MAEFDFQPGTNQDGQEDAFFQQLKKRIENKLAKQSADMSQLTAKIGEIAVLNPVGDVVKGESRPQGNQHTLHLLKLEKEKNEGLRKEVDTLKEKLTITEERLSSLGKSTEELVQLKSLNQHLAQELEATKAKMKSLQATEKLVKKNVSSLERNLEQLSTMYNQVAEQKSILKQENQEFEKILAEKDETLTLLETRLKEMEEDTIETISHGLDSESAVYVVGRASYPGNRLKKGGKHHIKLLDAQNRLSVRNLSEVPRVIRNHDSDSRHQRRSLDGTNA